MRRRTKCIAVATLLAASVAAYAQAYTLTGDIAGTHDPAIAHEGATYYVFSTGKANDGGLLPIRCSPDLLHWHDCGHVFDQLPAWIQQRSPQTHDLWAPDISYTHGEYRLYYAYSLFGKNASGIALATNTTLDPASPQYRWVDHGLVLASQPGDNFNAIDPNFLEDTEGHPWLAYGSFWDGIQLRALDPVTGKPATHSKAVLLAAKPDSPEVHAIEAPFLIAHDGFYYLFVSEGFCCRGAQSTYHTLVGRSRTITGPYLDREGHAMRKGGGTLVLSGNAHWAGPGGESILTELDGSTLIVFHAYDTKTGTPVLQISPLSWADGWPHAALGTQ